MSESLLSVRHLLGVSVEGDRELAGSRVLTRGVDTGRHGVAGSLLAGLWYRVADVSVTRVASSTRPASKTSLLKYTLAYRSAYPERNQRDYYLNLIGRPVSYNFVN